MCKGPEARTSAAYCRNRTKAYVTKVQKVKSKMARNKAREEIRDLHR